MRLREIQVENVRSFLQPATLQVQSNICILIGPNGGGKTNLLDIATTTLRVYLLSSWVSRRISDGVTNLDEFIPNDQVRPAFLEKHHQGNSRRQRITLILEVTESDIRNIVAIQAASPTIDPLDGIVMRGGNKASISANWDIQTLRPGLLLTYTVINGSLQAPPDDAHRIFREFLNHFELLSQKMHVAGLGTLTTPMLSLPVNRSHNQLQLSVTLANHNEGDHKKGVDAATSRSGASTTIVAIGRLAKQWRELLELADGRTRERFYADEKVVHLTQALQSLGYTWELKCTNTNNNQFEILLTKQGVSFLASSASSGEKELLTYLLSIYALGVRDALVIVDEPELHLHPRWQKILLGLFERLAADTGNQFVLATHSPTFIAPSSIQYVSRVHSEMQQSRITRLNDLSLPDRKYLFQVVNSQNNERIFFADLVVLVEGVSDRIVFERLLDDWKAMPNSYQGIVEIIDVGGKGFFPTYQKLLRACRIRHSLIADLDYIEQIGTAIVKDLFELDTKELVGDVLNNPKSLDGAELAAAIDEAIDLNSIDRLKTIWPYILRRRKRLKVNLSYEQMGILNCFTFDQKCKGDLLLRWGALEDYLPIGFKKKDLEPLIRLVEGDDLKTRLPNGSYGALRDVLLDAIEYAQV